MKTTNILAIRAALVAGLLLGSNAWLCAQNTNLNQIAPLGDEPVRQQDKATVGLSTNGQSSPVMAINKGSSLIGTTIKNQQGEELGKIRDLVIDFNSGRVAYLVLDSAPGILSSSKLHAVPLRAFQPSAEGTSLVLNADKAKLAASEGFAKNNWPAVTTATWGAEPFWKDFPGTPDSQEERGLYDQKTKDQQTKDQQTKENKDSTIEPKIPQSQPQP